MCKFWKTFFDREGELTLEEAKQTTIVGNTVLIPANKQTIDYRNALTDLCQDVLFSDVWTKIKEMRELFLEEEKSHLNA